MNSIDTTINQVEWTDMIRISEMVAQHLQAHPVQAHVAMTPATGGATNYLQCDVVGLSIVDHQVCWQVIVGGTAYGAKSADIIWGDE